MCCRLFGCGSCFWRRYLFCQNIRANLINPTAPLSIYAHVFFDSACSLSLATNNTTLLTPRNTSTSFVCISSFCSVLFLIFLFSATKKITSTKKLTRQQLNDTTHLHWFRHENKAPCWCFSVPLLLLFPAAHPQFWNFLLYFVRNFILIKKCKTKKILGVPAQYCWFVKMTIKHVCHTLGNALCVSDPLWPKKNTSRHTPCHRITYMLLTLSSNYNIFFWLICLSIYTCFDPSHLSYSSQFLLLLLLLKLLLLSR